LKPPKKDSIPSRLPLKNLIPKGGEKDEYPKSPPENNLRREVFSITESG